MATVYKDCPQCGAPIRFRFTVLNSSRSHLRAEWMISSGHVCHDCLTANRTAENQKAAAANAAAGLPSLLGTEKQIAWAESIRASILAQIDAIETALLLLSEGRKDASAAANRDAGFWARETEFLKSNRQGGIVKLTTWLAEMLRSQDKATWWIDNRDTDPRDLVQQLAEPCTDPAAASTDGEALSAATIQPETPLSNTVATVSIQAQQILIEFAEKRDDFRQLVKFTLGYRWNGNAWALIVGPTHGAPEDRAAEAIHAMLNAGFIVCCLDTTVRSRALDASFEPRYPRWISYCTSGKWAGYLCVGWFDENNDDGLHGDLGTIAGAQKSYYQARCWFVRPEEYAALRDFAERHQFRLTPDAERQLAYTETQEHARLLAKDLPEARRANAQSQADDLSVPEGIHHELRDD